MSRRRDIGLVRDLGGLVALAQSIQARGARAFGVERQLAEGHGWHAATSAEGDGIVLDIEITDIISEWFGVSPSEIISRLRATPDATQIRVALNSPGGDAIGGIAIYDALLEHRAEVEVRVLGWAASAASYIAQAGDTRIMAAGSMMMVHNPWGIAIGEQADMEAMATVLGKITTSVTDLYQARTGQDRQQITDWLDGETWFTAMETVEAGLADRALPPKKTGNGGIQNSAGDGGTQNSAGDSGRTRPRILDTTSMIAALKGALQ